MKTPEIRNVAAEFHGKSPCVSWQAGDARYHVWLNDDLRTVQPAFGRRRHHAAAGSIYKNSSDTSNNARARTQYLDAASKANAAMLREALATVERGDLWSKARAEVAEIVAREQRERKARARAIAISEAASELFEALRVVTAALELYTGDGCNDARALDAYTSADEARHVDVDAIAKIGRDLLSTLQG